MDDRKLKQKNCQELIEIKHIQEAYNSPEIDTLLDRILHCIYEFYTEKIKKNVVYECGADMDKYVREDLAEEAFQRGIIVFYEYTKKRGIRPGATIEYIVKVFCQWQFRFLKQKNFRERQRIRFYSEEDLLKKEQSRISIIEETIERDDKSFGDAIKLISSKEEYILYQGIEKLKSKKWKKVMRLRYFFGRETDEIAKEMRVSKDDIYNTIAKAKKALEKILNDQFNPE